MTYAEDDMLMLSGIQHFVVCPRQWALMLKHKLSQIIDKESDSIRFYFMGNNWDRHIERMGKAEQLNQGSCLIL